MTMTLMLIVVVVVVVVVTGVTAAAVGGVVGNGVGVVGVGVVLLVVLLMLFVGGGGCFTGIGGCLYIRGVHWRKQRLKDQRVVDDEKCGALKEPFFIFQKTIGDTVPDVFQSKIGLRYLKLQDRCFTVLSLSANGKLNHIPLSSRMQINETEYYYCL
jgi:hypothetical protein